MPTNSHTGENYTVTSSGTNDQGNSYDHRVSDSGDHSYHYSNKYTIYSAIPTPFNPFSHSNGSYYYSNSDGSTYYNSGSGYSNYTSPDGNSHTSYSSSK
ncbi:hypothetical protein C8T65DRAFT_736738 [Cerioporus squamosus]|nr:hypothetical protein C8T65DRAFT_736738 [Cerioporus squamosus]